MQMPSSILVATFFGALLAAPLTAQTTVHVDFEFTPNTPASSERFGQSLDMDGGLAIVGAPENSEFAGAGGAAYAFVREPDGTWTEEAAFDVVNPGFFQRLGSNVAISGGRVALAAPTTQQRVELYRRSAPGIWVPDGVILPPATDVVEFGSSVALDGDRLAIGTTGSGFLGLGPGRAYIYERAGGGNWFLASTITSGIGGNFQGFASEMRFQGDRLAIGSSGDTTAGVDAAGAVYMVERQSNGTWLPTDVVREPVLEVGGRFGCSVALDGDRLVVGAYGADISATDMGEVHVFTRQPDATWLHETEFTASDVADGDSFGETLDVYDGRLVVGSPGAESNGIPAGAAYLFERRADGTWFESARIELETPVSFDGLGSGVSTSIALDGEQVLLGTRVRNDFQGGVQVLDLGTLLHARSQISVAAGGSQSLSLRAGVERAGDVYLMLGSLTGTSPAVPLGGGVELPLVPDAYTDLCVAVSAPLAAPFGVLGPDGEAQSAFVLPPAAAAGFTGLTVHHAYIAIDLLTFDVFASNAVDVLLVP
ncbi:hypothetical protein Pla163_13250 [Planctomycetes bacterium Pla163]|uniref:FG-GAP repeat protein n=1 Tax=Rohdeia mirabilis TaxID=2528008 RepID=A0A518CYB7_9BACT|nr:hypothetical protein Pla163_13250 [Planctomycetes bacterium Pla163]